MLRVVIVDDEPVLVRSLQTMIERADCGFDVVGTANDSLTGLSMIRDIMPDLVFVDISMPVMDGLQMIECLRREENDVSVVILSGFKEFDYAKRAVVLDVEEYLVKPINPVDFKPLLERIAQRIQKGRHEKIRMLINRMIEPPATGETISPWVHDLRFDCWKICFGVFSYYREMGVDASGEELRKILLDVIKVCCCGKEAWLFETRYTNEFNLFMITDDANDQRILAVYDACQKAVKKQMVTIALGGKALKTEELQLAVKRAGAVLQTGVKFDSSSFLLEKTPSAGYNKEEVATLCNLLRANETTKASRLLQQILKRRQERTCTQADLALLLKLIIQGCGNEDLQVDADYHVGILLEQSADYEMLFQNLESLLFQTNKADEFKLNDKSTRAIIDAVANHLVAHASEKITLQAVAKEFGFNYTYLSYLFKKNVGKSPSEFLTQCRIDQAKRLLIQPSDYSVKEISNSVGYEDPYYFSRVFKATTGLSPSEYRKQNR